MNIESIVKESFSFSDVARKLGKPTNGQSIKEIKKLLINSDTSHFGRNRQIKYPYVEKKCPVCSSLFRTQSGAPRETFTCSYSCSNTHFRSGTNNPNYGKWTSKENEYRRVCFEHHSKKCVVCPETNVVAVHHYDENHDNNHPTNLIPMCPTHHLYMHSQFKSLICEKVDKYRNKFIKQFNGQ